MLLAIVRVDNGLGAVRMVMVEVVESGGWGMMMVMMAGSSGVYGEVNLMVVQRGDNDQNFFSFYTEHFTSSLIWD